MNILMVFKIIAAIATVMTGLLALVKPTAVQGFTWLKIDGARGVSEVRAIFGGLFIALGLMPLFFVGMAYRMLGISYLAIAAVRAFSIIFEKSYDRSNWYSLAIEIVLGVILVL